MADEFKYDIDSDSDTTSTNTFDIVGLDNIKTDNAVKADLNLALVQPFKAETASALELKPLQLTIKPLKADLDLDHTSNLTLDLKPAVVDLALTTNIGKVPNLCIRLPYRHHVGFTWLGTELWGFTFSGQQDMTVEEIERQPKVVWEDHAHHGSSHHVPHRPKPPSKNAGGLHIRLDK